MKRLDFKVSQNIFDDLLEFRNKLPERATGQNKAGGMQSYDHPAGLALLGEDAGLVDTVIPLKMSGGCWDAPNINYDDMDKGFRALLNTGRRCVGMAFIRNPRWGSGWDAPQYEAKLSQNVRYEIHKLKNSFEDISKTIWIVLHNENFRFFKPCITDQKRMNINEIKVESNLKIEKEKTIEFIEKKLKKDKAAKEAKARLKKQQALIAKQQAEAIAKERKKKLDFTEALEKDFKEKIKETIDLGNGFCYILNHEGKYILWQTRRR